MGKCYKDNLSLTNKGNMIYLYFDVACLMLTYMEIHYKGEYFQVKYAEFRCRQLCIAAYANKGELNLIKL